MAVSGIALRAARALSLATILASTAGVCADSSTRARVNYMIHCQGCHLPEAMGHPGKVPRMNGFLGWFTHTSNGRRYLAQVPGVASAALEDFELAELLNWILTTYSAQQLAPQFRPYTAEEIGDLRQFQETDPDARRLAIIQSLARTGVVLPQSY